MVDSVPSTHTSTAVCCHSEHGYITPETRCVCDRFSWVYPLRYDGRSFRRPRPNRQKANANTLSLRHSGDPHFPLRLCYTSILLVTASLDGRVPGYYPNARDSCVFRRRRRSIAYSCGMSLAKMRDPQNRITTPAPMDNASLGRDVR
jgi:hypothetical protein